MASGRYSTIFTPVNLIRASAASALTLALMFWARFQWGFPLTPELLTEKLFTSLPLPLFSFFVGLLGGVTKYLAFGLVTAAYFLALLALGLALPAVVSELGAKRIWVRGLAFISLFWLFSLALVYGVLGWPGVNWFLSLFLWSLLYGFILALPRWGRVENMSRERRQAMSQLARAGLLLFVGSSLGLFKAGLAWSQDLFRQAKGLSPEVTPNEKFYTVSKNIFDPDVDARNWTLEITGLVENRLAWKLEDLKKMPAVTQYATLICISNQVGGDLIGNALWKGVPLDHLLKLAGIKPSARELILYAHDDYTDSIPLAKGLEPGILLAYEMNGQPLAASHGYPARLIVPGIYGMKNVKWLTRIELADYDYKGYWETQGWSDEAIIKTTSRIDVPRNGQSLSPGEPVVGGIAFSGDRGIRDVEVSADGGKTWQKAQVKKALSPYTWVLWAWPWKISSAWAGRTLELKARATDGRGKKQAAQATDPLPDGASGLHAVKIKIKA